MKALFDAGSNNLVGTSTLTNIFVNGANETGRPAFNSTTLSSYFSNAGYIGAVRGDQDNWWKSWTCGLGAGAMSCQSIPAAG